MGLMVYTGFLWLSIRFSGEFLCSLNHTIPEKKGETYDQLHKKSFSPLNYLDNMDSFSESDTTSLVGSVSFCPFPL